jgi:hypothetical protein
MDLEGFVHTNPRKGFRSINLDKMKIISVQLVLLISGVAANGEDFTNNLFSDLAP